MPSRVLELSDRFLDISKEGQWFVMFYAPWCGHCKRLEPIWAHVAQSLYKTNIRVGRLDCTRFTSVATEFGISGYPTIIFLKGETRHIFKADRTKDELVNFALRLSGPPVQHITKDDSLDMIRSYVSLFFVYVGGRSGYIWDTYHHIASTFQPHAFFYSVDPEIAAKQVKLKHHPAIFVYKEDTHYFFKDGEKLNEDSVEEINSTLLEWINVERFPTFLKVTHGNMHQLMTTKKNVVLAVVEENKLEEIPPEMLDFRDMVESVIVKYRDKFHKHFQFGWIGSPSLANSIAMHVLPLPHLIVINSTTKHHHIPEDDPAHLTAEAIVIFLERIHNQSAPTYGGSTITVQAYRTYFEMRTALTDMWRGNPVLTAVIFGLPLGFLSLLCYSIWCADIMDADDDEEDDAGTQRACRRNPPAALQQHNIVMVLT